MAQLILNQNLDRILEIPFVQDFIQRQRMKTRPITDEDDYGLLIYRFPYALSFHEALSDSSLDIYLADLKSNQMLYASTANGLCLDMGLQDIVTLRKMDFKNHPQNSIFLSEGSSKMLSLHTDLDAIDKLLPLIEGKGGLMSLKDGTFDKNFELSHDVLTLPAGLSEKLSALMDN
jgi:hypothetical protein